MDIKMDTIENLDHFQNEYTIVQENIHRTSSTVWRYFGSLKKNDEIIDTTHVYCSQCFDQRKTKKYQKSTSTGNLLKHLKKAHEIVVDQPLFRVKRERDGLYSVAKTEYVDGSGSQLQDEESDNEYLVEDINEVLIMEIQKRPQIYDSSLCTKNKNQIRRELWIEIYHVMNQLIPLEKLPKIWKNIRDRYHKIRKDIQPGSNKKPKYRYYDLLRFLDNHCHPKVKPENNTFNNSDGYANDSSYEEVDNNLDPHMDMSEYVQVKPRKTFVNTMKEVKLESFSNNEQQIEIINEIPCKKRKLSEIEIDETEHHLEEEDEQYGQQIIEEITDNNVTSDPLVDMKLQLSSSSAVGNDDVDDDDDDENIDYVGNTIDSEFIPVDDVVEDESNQPIIHLLETSESTIPSMLPAPTSSMVTTVSTLPKIQIKSKTNSSGKQQLSKSQIKKILSSSPSSAATATTSKQQQHRKPPPTDIEIFGVNTLADTSFELSTTGNKKSNEFDIFGDFVGQVMKEMSKSKARLLQMKILQLISEYDG